MKKTLQVLVDDEQGGRWYEDLPIGQSGQLLRMNAQGNYEWIAPSVSSHTHPESDITNLLSDLAGKAALAHNHDLIYAAINHSHTIGQGGIVYAALANGTTQLAFGTNTTVKLTPNANATLTTTVPPAGVACQLIILTSGTSSYTLTFGSGFKATGTLATGTTSARVFVISFISDGVNLYERSRTAAMVA